RLVVLAPGLQLLEPPVPLRQDLDRLLLVLEHRRLEALLQRLDDADPPGHPAEPLLDAEEGDLEVEEDLVPLADLAEQVPVVAPPRPAVAPRLRERLAVHLLVHPRQAVVELVLLVQPDAGALVQLFQADELQVADLVRPFPAAALLGVEHPP